jgi:hypothetical protein
MSASKASAYLGLLIAVAAGALLSDGIKQNFTNTLPVSDPLVMRSMVVPSRPEPPVITLATWKPQVLKIGNIRMRVDLPSAGVPPTCIAPGPSDDEVGVCQPTARGTETSIWQIRVVTQRDRFVPVSWFDEVVQLLRNGPSDALIRQLRDEANLSAKAGFLTAELLPPDKLPGALAVRGAANGASLIPVSPQSCVYAFFLSRNRPTAVLYCATDDLVSLEGAQRLVGSLQKYNGSTEYERTSARGAEHAFYLKRLKVNGGPTEMSDLVASEQAFQQSASSECEKYPVISQERYECHEAFASARIEALSP